MKRLGLPGSKLGVAWTSNEKPGASYPFGRLSRPFDAGRVEEAVAKVQKDQKRGSKIKRNGSKGKASGKGSKGQKGKDKGKGKNSTSMHRLC